MRNAVMTRDFQRNLRITGPINFSELVAFCENQAWVRADKWDVWRHLTSYHQGALGRWRACNVDLTFILVADYG